MPRRVLLVDNHDSYTYNLAHLIARVTGAPPAVVRNNELTAGEALAREDTHIVISPGPGNPGVPTDFGMCGDLIRRSQVPLLGVCLGHQGIALAFGGTVERVAPAHGKVDRISHDGCCPLFATVPKEFAAVRYHSLAVTSVPPELAVSARSADGQVMAIRHRQRSLFGVQFHPESVLSDHGEAIIGNFLALRGAPPLAGPPAEEPLRHSESLGMGTESAARERRADAAADREQVTTTRRPPVAPAVPIGPAAPYVTRLDAWCDPEPVFRALSANRTRAFWLDSATRTPWTGRYSYIGVLDEHELSVTYDVATRTVTEHRRGKRRVAGDDLFAYLSRSLAAAQRSTPPGVPFDFTGGWVGYLGYECKGLTIGTAAHRAGTPDACLLWVRTFVAFDHADCAVYVVSDDEKAGRELAEQLGAGVGRAEPSGRGLPSLVTVVDTWTPARYQRAFDEVQRHLHAGNSYEINLTYQTRVACGADPYAVYRVLRDVNPAPYAAFLRHHDLAVLSSSPERFLAIDARRRVEVRPIKGTLPRGRSSEQDARLKWQLATDPRFHCENLMIVDLLRNDLSIVCTPDTVQVTDLMAVEAYANVFQMVTTVEGILDDSVDAVGAVRALFPAGSMTGAPKRRTTEIIDAVEGAPRGIYSGALGWLGRDGRADLSVVIRTLVAHAGAYSFGVGGGVTVMSDAETERIEARLKGERLLRALFEASGRHGEPESSPPNSSMKEAQMTADGSGEITDDEITRVIRELLASVAPDPDGVRKLAADDDLATSANLDSLGLISFLAALERTYPLDLSTRLEEFRSVQNLRQVANMVRRGLTAE